MADTVKKGPTSCLPAKPEGTSSKYLAALKRFPLQTSRERIFALALVLGWALLFLPNLRTNPNWYSDEGEVMEMSWNTVHGHPRIGPVRTDFMFPHPYPPLYLIVNGTLLRVFGYDIVVGRALQAVIALVTAAVLFWVGTRLRNKNFGFLCAAAFLLYPETVMNCRWVRPHPMAGLLALSAVGFLIRYVQERRLRDVIWAGILSSLGTGTHYYVYPLMGAVVVTAFFVNKRHIVPSLLGTAVFPVGFVGWFLTTQPGGITHLVTQIQRVGEYGTSATSTFVENLARIYRNIITFGLLTPTLAEDRSFQGFDVWLIVASLGLVFCFPVARFRKWLAFWLLALMYPVFKQQDNLPIFFYPAMVFLPLLALGFAGAVERVSEIAGRRFTPATSGVVVASLGVFGLMSLVGSLGHFRTKVDPWTVHSSADAEAAMNFVNSHTTSQDFVIVPKHLNWLVHNARLSSLPHVVAYEGKTNGVYTIPVPREFFWFDCDWPNAKYLVLAYGRDAAGQPYGFDVIYNLGFEGIREIIGKIQAEKWPVVFQKGEFMVLANPKFVKTPER